MSIEKIKELVSQFIYNVDNGIQENIEYEFLSKYNTSIRTAYSISDDVEKLLFEVGVILNNQILIDGFKKPKTIEQIVSEITEDKCPEDFEELEEIESERDADSVPRYVYVIQIMKHIPTGKFYQFTTQSSGDCYFKAEFMGEVIQKEIITTQWVNK